MDRSHQSCRALQGLAGQWKCPEHRIPEPEVHSKIMVFIGDAAFDVHTKVREWFAAAKAKCDSPCCWSTCRYPAQCKHGWACNRTHTCSFCHCRAPYDFVVGNDVSVRGRRGSIVRDERPDRSCVVVKWHDSEDWEDNEHIEIHEVEKPNLPQPSRHSGTKGGRRRGGRGQLRGSLQSGGKQLNYKDKWCGLPCHRAGTWSNDHHSGHGVQCSAPHAEFAAASTWSTHGQFASDNYTDISQYVLQGAWHVDYDMQSGHSSDLSGQQASEWDSWRCQWVYSQ